MQKRKYDFSKPSDEAPKNELRQQDAEIVTPIVEQITDYKKPIETLEQLRAESDLIWDSIKNRKLD